MSENGLRTTPLRDNIRVYTLGGESIVTSFGANCTAVAGRDSVLLVDPLIAPVYAGRIEAEVKSWTDVPVRFVALTHHHTDHALGAGYFAAQGATVVAHAACCDRMVAEHPGLIQSRRRRPEIAELFRDAEAYRPTEVFEKEFTVDLGGTEARILHPGSGHTPGDSIVYLPSESVAVCGDLVSSGYHVNYEDASIENLETGLEVLRALGARTHVPGHGLTGGTELLDEQTRYHRTVRALAADAPDQTEFSRRLRDAFPGFLLREGLPTGFVRLHSWGKRRSTSRVPPGS